MTGAWMSCRHLPQTTMPSKWPPCPYFCSPSLSSPTCSWGSQGDALETLVVCVTTLCHGSHFGKTEALQDTALIPRPHRRTSVLSSCLPCAPTPQDLCTHGFHARNVILGIATHGASAGASFPLSSSLILSKTALSVCPPQSSPAWCFSTMHNSYYLKNTYASFYIVHTAVHTQTRSSTEVNDV